jgi:predicted anti-sigma-YlaC factor YlaD
MMNCKQATQLLSEKLDRTLSTKEKLALRMHIAMCSACRKFGHQMEDIHHISKCYMKKSSQNKNN